MSQSQKHSVNFTRPQIQVLREEAEKLGITVSDLVRRIVDDWRSRGK